MTHKNRGWIRRVYHLYRTCCSIQFLIIVFNRDVSLDEGQERREEAKVVCGVWAPSLLRCCEWCEFDVETEVWNNLLLSDYLKITGFIWYLAKIKRLGDFYGREALVGMILITWGISLPLTPPEGWITLKKGVRDLGFFMIIGIFWGFFGIFRDFLGFFGIFSRKVYGIFFK